MCRVACILADPVGARLFQEPGRPVERQDHEGGTGMALSGLRARKRCPLGAGCTPPRHLNTTCGRRAGCPGLRSRLWRTGRNLGGARTVPRRQIARKARVHRRRSPAISPACRGGDSDFEAARLVGVIGDPASVRETTAEPSTAWLATNGAGLRPPVRGESRYPLRRGTASGFRPGRYCRCGRRPG